MVRGLQPTFSSAIIADVEASIDGEAEKNALCTPVPMSDAPQDRLRMILMNLTNQGLWRRDPEFRDRGSLVSPTAWQTGTAQSPGPRRSSR
jgi:hypothetical protein